MNQIRKVRQNKQLAAKKNAEEHKIYSTEEILGTMQPVRDFALFYTKHKIDLEVIHDSLLLDFCNEPSFTADEKNAFQLGIDLFLKFFEDSQDDVDAYLLEAEEKNRREKEAKKPVG